MLRDINQYLKANAASPKPKLVITFYLREDLYGFFSNFSRHVVDLEGWSWPTSEHYFQAMKSMDLEVRKKIRDKPTPGQAAYLGRSTTLRSDWNSPVSQSYLTLAKEWKQDIPTRPDTYVELVKDLAMWRAIRAKFTQHQDLTECLLNTKDAILVEAADADPYWGWGPSKTGANKLGFLLMELRSTLVP